MYVSTLHVYESSDNTLKQGRVLKVYTHTHTHGFLIDTNTTKRKSCFGIQSHGARVRNKKAYNDWLMHASLILRVHHFCTKVLCVSIPRMGPKAFIGFSIHYSTPRKGFHEAQLLHENVVYDANLLGHWRCSDCQKKISVVCVFKGNGSDLHWSIKSWVTRVFVSFMESLNMSMIPIMIMIFTIVNTTSHDHHAFVVGSRYRMRNYAEIDHGNYENRREITSRVMGLSDPTVQAARYSSLKLVTVC